RIVNGTKKKNDLLAALAERLRGDRQFMAHVLSDYQQRMGLDDEALAGELGAPPEMVVSLAICKRPDVLQASFENDLRDLSDYPQADEQVLSRVIEAWSRV